ncbi:Class I SAM-dependent methyltransferase [Glutamicibacter creatinolyticus]|uniref:Class I SAM-dependent methyltransferase n=1 Tax=Glutamicibacter creatinolyticus TaxID=162496 RepID=A0A5B7WX69_9MICC|nr:class I SAM-dependent methyltransferase [Glutamicibacter creatinolyticus]QCY48519.1 Class I SAM-dependent methyltransferase [Glutamicibacter creatinolyticus]
MTQHSGEELVGKDFWESHYGRSERIWSGNVNSTLAAALKDLAPGSALDLGCGEGGDALWLAARGWQVTGVDISETAVARAREAAAEHGMSESTEFIAVDLAEWDDQREFDLVTLSFFQAPFDFQRAEIQRRATERVAVGGRIVVLSHGSHPSWAGPGAKGQGHAHHPAMPTVDDELRALGMPTAGWEVLRAELVQREVTGPEGQHATIDDVLVVARRS